MKPDKVICRNCGKEIVKGKWCSDKCRMAFNRTKANTEHEQKQGEHEQIVPEQLKSEQPEHDDFRSTLTKTDKTFYDRALRDFKEPYYKFDFDNPIRELTCARCGANFKTRLHLLLYCSYQHYTLTIAGRKD